MSTMRITTIPNPVVVAEAMAKSMMRRRERRNVEATRKNKFRKIPTYFFWHIVRRIENYQKRVEASRSKCRYIEKYGEAAPTTIL